VRRNQRSGVTTIAPDGSRKFVPHNRRATLHAQAPTPPQLPSDPKQGRAWVILHNEQLLELIRELVNRDDAQMQTFTAKETQVAGSDLFMQVEYRTLVLQFLARP
jgi:hypothetical protein